MVDITQVSFAKGEISPIAAARTDENFYSSALAQAVNFFIRREGGASNRPGLEFIAPCASNAPNGSYMIPFIYNNQQAYLTEFSPGSTAIYENGVSITSVSNPYALADVPSLRWAQSADVLSVVVDTQPLMELTRQTLTNFTLSSPTLLFGPFQDTNTDGTTTVYASATQGTVTLTASAAIFKPSHVGTPFYLQEQFLGSIQPWTAAQTWQTGGNAVAGALCRSDGKIYLAVGPAAPGGTALTITGQYQPVHTFGTQWDGNQGVIVGAGAGNNAGIEWQFLSSDAGVALITAFTDSKHVTAVVQSNKGIWANFPPTVVGGPQTTVGPFTYSGDGSTATFTGLTSITTADPNQFYVTVGGIFQDPSTYSISLSGTSITFFTPPVTGSSNVIVSQITGTLDNLNNGTLSAMTGLCLSTYWAFGSFSQIQGYAGDVCYFDDRLMQAATQLQPQTFFGSKVSDYHNYGVSSPQVDSDAITETLNSRQQNPIVAMIPLNQLLLGTATSTQLVTNSAADGSITPSDISVVPQEFYGLADVPTVLTGSTALYVQWGGRKIRDVVYQYFSGKFIGQELTLLARENMFPLGTTCTRIAYAPDPFGLLYCVRSDGVLCVCSYTPQLASMMPTEQQAIGWSRFITDGKFEDVCILPENNTFAVYVIVGRTINGVYKRYIERFAAREFADINDMFFVDSGLTYDGRNTSTTTMILTGGTSWLAGDTGTLSASSVGGWATFVSQDATDDNVIFLYDASGNRARVQLITITSAVLAGVRFLDPIPTSLRSAATSVWTFARTVFSGLTNLPNQTVAVQADGAVMPQQIVSNAGSFTLPYAAGVVHAGLPYVCQLQSLNFNIQGQESIRNRMKTLTRVSAVVDESAPFDVGSDFEHLTKVAMREFENYGFPTTLATGVVQVTAGGEQSDDLSLCLQQSDPAPVTVLGWQVDIDLGQPL